MKNLVALFAAGTIVAALGCGDPVSPTPSEPSQSLSAASAPLSFAQVSMGSGHACGVTTGNKAYCWGSNDGGKLGSGSIKPVDNYSPTPVAVMGGLSFRAISAGSTHSCGLTTDDRAYCWGDNYAAQLGDGTRNHRTRPTAVSGGHRFRQLRAGHIHTCAVTFTDLVFCWGDNSRGQLGDGSITDRWTPVPVMGPM
jgi:alpha-tubulin suppressor-like RCC1 family protein